MTQFNLAAICKIDTLSVRKSSYREGNVRVDNVLAVEVKLSCVTHGPSVLPAIMGADNEGDVHSAFWGPVDHSPLFSGVERIESWASFENRHTIQFGKKTCRASKVSEFRFTPKDDHAVSLEFAVVISQPDSALLSVLASHVKDDIRVALTADDDLLDGCEPAGQQKKN